MFGREDLALVAVLGLFSAIGYFQGAEAHPGCVGDVSLGENLEASFCPTEFDPLYAEGFCCDADHEADIILQLEASSATGRCLEMQQEVLCTKCHPYSKHLYQRLGTGLTMTAEFCQEYFDECSSPNQLDLDEGYCDVHAAQTEDGEDQYWSHPLGEQDTFNGDAVEAFPSINIRFEIGRPVDMRMTPDGNKWWIVEQEGRIAEIDVSDPESEPSSLKVVLDISDAVTTDIEEGLLSLAFSPGFHTSGVFFVTYTPLKRPGSVYTYNQLSRFEYDELSAENTRLSEEKILDTSDKNYVYHSAGWIGFKPSAYQSDNRFTWHELYWAIGDSGDQHDKSQQGQNPDTLHGSILRIRLNSLMRRKYQIPDGNPFKNGGGRREICAWGLRNPWRCSFDRANDDLWCGDVGQDEVESIKIIECGNNYGWRQFEGHRCHAEILDGGIGAVSDTPGEPDIPYEFPTGCDNPASRAPYTFPEFSYCHPDYAVGGETGTPILPEIPNDDFCGNGTIYGTAIIGGFVYRGQKYADLLGGNYVWADYTNSRLYHLFPDEENGWGTADGNKWGYGVIKGSNLPKPVSLAEDNNGELYIIEQGRTIWEFPCGDLCDGVPDDQVDPPTPPPVSLLPTPAPVPLPSPTLEPVGCYRDALPRMMGQRAAFSEDTMTTELKLRDVIHGRQNAEHELIPYYLDVRRITPPLVLGHSLLLCRNRTAKRQICGVLCLDSYYVGTQNGNECYCGGASTDLDIYCNDASCSNANCNKPCSGDSSETCGGTWAMSVFRKGDEEPPSTCSNDLLGVEGTGPDGVACCPETCLNTNGEPQCGGPLCGQREGGAKSCCVGTINKKGVDCAVSGTAPCYIDSQPPTPTPEGYAALGCAIDALEPNRIMPVGPFKLAAMSAQICYEKCIEQPDAFNYFGTQYMFECWCADSLPSGVTYSDDNGCTMQCTGNPEEICGGEFAMSVYQVEAPIYEELGCHVDPLKGPNGGRVLSVGPIRQGAMSAKICYDLCQNTVPGFQFFGTQYGNECFCDTALPSYVSFDPEHDGCGKTCLGNAPEICGGTFSITLYSVL